MSESWDEMRKAKEEAFFRKQNEEALKRIQEREQSKPRLSPISGEPMEQINYMGVILDRCSQSGGIWLDAGELEQIIEASKHQDPATGQSWADSFFSFLKKKS